MAAACSWLRLPAKTSISRSSVKIDPVRVRLPAVCWKMALPLVAMSSRRVFALVETMLIGVAAVSTCVAVNDLILPTSKVRSIACDAIDSSPEPIVTFAPLPAALSRTSPSATIVRSPVATLMSLSSTSPVARKVAAPSDDKLTPSLMMISRAVSEAELSARLNMMPPADRSPARVKSPSSTVSVRIPVTSLPVTTVWLLRDSMLATPALLEVVAMSIVPTSTSRSPEPKTAML